MKFLVDEMPRFKEDCPFAEQEWSGEEEVWVNYCKVTSARCDLDLKNGGCSWLQSVVCCGGCKHFHELWGCTKNKNEYLVVDPDDFCSYGERRKP